MKHSHILAPLGGRPAAPALAAFRETLAPGTADKYHELLLRLRPDRLTLDELAGLVRWVEEHGVREGRRGPHANIFGTGGDGTVNISSIAAMMASRLVPVVKVGTPAVTSRFGSVDFMEALRARLASGATLPAHRWMAFQPGSCYLPLATFGYGYNETLRKARRRLKEEGVPDVYKVVFPLAQYTAPVVQINGCAGPVYAGIYRELAAVLGRRVCVVESETGIDELMPGRNRVTLVSAGKGEDYDWSFQAEQAGRVREVFRERDTLEETLALFERAMGPAEALSADEALIRETLLQNAALVAACFLAVTTRPAEGLPALMRRSLDLLNNETA